MITHTNEVCLEVFNMGYLNPITKTTGVFENIKQMATANLSTLRQTVFASPKMDSRNKTNETNITYKNMFGGAMALTR